MTLPPGHAKDGPLPALKSSMLPRGAGGIAMGHLGQGDLKEQWLDKTQGGEKNTTWHKQTDNTNSLAGID